MSIIGKRKIWVGPADDANCHPLIVEGLAVDAITPGSIVEQVSGGLQTLSTAATIFGAECLVALEYGCHTGGTVDVDYAIGDNTLAGQARSGEFYNALVATGQALTKGMPLSSNADGTLKIAVTPAVVGATSEQVLFYSDETVTTTAAQLVRVRKA
ncbi:MAG: hypothetical protein COA43_14785 [Robiginitomaculum sp.]|nr:MAG: hypothetical protein COA43_14785 [Robiginitomaculum sp.]